MSRRPTIDAVFAHWVEQHVVHGRRLPPEALCGGDAALLDDLRACIREYDRLALTLDPDGGDGGDGDTAREPPEWPGLRTLERLGGGGGGEVYKVEDLRLGRLMAAKVLRPGDPLRAGLDGFLREARALALFDDPRIVRLYELREDADPPVLLMEYVEGFQLGRIAPSLSHEQHARLMAAIAGAIETAHAKGLQHRDLKPANVMVDSALRPRILDFGLSGGDPHRGHGRGTPEAMAPEQLDPGRPIDARSDVYALGVIFYEMLCGQAPYRGDGLDELLAAIRAGQPRLPVELAPGVPEPLQAIALTAMERRPEDRYQTAGELAAELRRWLDGRPVLARPTVYRSTLERRIRPHMEQIREWSRVRLIHGHEAERLARAYRDLELPDEDWLIRSRSLSFAQISLYLGAFLLLCGGLLYFGAWSMDAVRGAWRPLVVLGLPLAGLELAAAALWRRRRRAVAVAYWLGAVTLLPLLLVIGLHEAGWWPAGRGAGELFGPGHVSNRQLQLAVLGAAVRALALAWRTRTLVLAAGFTALAVLGWLAVLADFGLERYVLGGEWDRVALQLAPLVPLALAGGAALERRGRGWLSRPLYVAAALALVAVLELLALDGRALAHLGLSLAPLQGSGVSDPTLLDTLAAMTANGVLIYVAGRLAERRGLPLMGGASRLLYVIAPFAILQPLAWLNHVGEYSRRFDWLYLALALAITLLSRFRQRKSFYYAGLLNTGGALWYLTVHHEWLDRPAWALVVLAAGLAALAAGLALHLRPGGSPGEP